MVQKFKQIGFLYVSLDLQGYRTWQHERELAQTGYLAGSAISQ